MRFRKKPVEIEAVQWTGDYQKVVDFLGGVHPAVTFDEMGMCIEITTLEGTMQAPAGWWIIRGVKGEFYPCRDDIFRETYEAVG